MKRAVSLSLLVVLAGCRPAARPVTYTSAAIYSVTCAAMAGAQILGTKPNRMTIEVDAELTATTAGESGRSVTPVAGRADGASAHTARITLDIDPATVQHCDQKQATPRLWLNSETGELATSPP